MRQPIHVGKVYAKYRRGESFTNAETLAVMEHYEVLAKLLCVSGEPFHLAFKEANQIAMAFEGFARSRNLI